MEDHRMIEAVRQLRGGRDAADLRARLDAIIARCAAADEAHGRGEIRPEEHAAIRHAARDQARHLGKVLMRDPGWHEVARDRPRGAAAGGGAPDG